MWGAFGNKPTDDPPNPAPADADPQGASQFVQPVHAARVSKDGLVYVSDRGGKRVQVFRLDGTYVTQVFIGRECKAPECGNGSDRGEHRILHRCRHSGTCMWATAVKPG